MNANYTVLFWLFSYLHHETHDNGNTQQDV